MATAIGKRSPATQARIDKLKSKLNPVKRWKDMSEKERNEVLERIEERQEAFERAERRVKSHPMWGVAKG